jgi:2-methylcitrate dehydratase PrpD
MSSTGSDFERTVRASLERLVAEAEPSRRPDRDLTYRTLVDYLACVAGGSRLPVVRRARAAAGIDGDWVLCGTDRGAPAKDAAFADAIAAHSQDFDDTHWTSTVHPSAVLWSCLFADRADGHPPDALALAHQDAIGFLNDLTPFVCPNHIRRGWHSTGTVGAMTGSVALGSLRGWDAPTRVRAVQLAGTLMGGLRSNNVSSAKALHAGQAASNATFAAQLAAVAELEGELSLSAVADAYGFVRSRTAEVGRASDVTFKPYPTCTGTHAAIEAMVRLARETPPDSISVTVPAIVAEETHDQWPASLMAARLGLPYVVAVAAVYGRADEAALERGRGDDRVRRLFGFISVHVDPPVVDEPYRSQASIVARWADETVGATVDPPRGDPRRPISTIELEDKLRLQSEQVWSTERQEEVLGEVARFAGGRGGDTLTTLVARSDLADGPATKW